MWAMRGALIMRQLRNDRADFVPGYSHFACNSLRLYILVIFVCIYLFNTATDSSTTLFYFVGAFRTYIFYLHSLI